MAADKNMVLHGIAGALRYGAAVAGAIAAAGFVLGFVANGFAWTVGLEWARRLTYVLGAVCLIAGGAGLFFSGSPRSDAAAGVASDETMRAFEHAVGISWPWALVVATADFVVLGVVLDLVARAV